MTEPQNPQKWHPSLKFLVGFLASLVIAFSPEYFVSSSVQVTAWVYLEYAPGAVQAVPLRITDLLQVILLGPGVGVVYFMLLRMLLRGVNAGDQRTRRRVSLLESFGILLIAVNSIGNAIHLFFNAVNAIDGSLGLGTGTYNGIDVTGYFLLIWFMDEWVGHTLVMVTYFGYLAMAAGVEYLARDARAARKGRGALVLFLGACIAVVDGYVAIQSETGFLLLLLHGAFFALVVGTAARKRIPLNRYPILMAMVVATFFVAAFNMFWIAAHGWKPFYPFYSANLE